MSTPRRVVSASLAMLLVAGIAAAALTEIWTYTFSVTGLFGGIAVASDGSVFWVGREKFKGYLERFDADGKRTGRTKLKPGEVPSQVVLTPDESMAIVGGESSGVPWVAAFMTGNGKRAWSMTMDDLDLAYISRIVVSADGNSIYVAGPQIVFGPDGWNIVVARLTSAGALMWKVLYNAGFATDLGGLGVDPKKEARVCIGGEGGDLGDAPYKQALVVCFDTADGSVVWDDLSGGQVGWDSIGGLVISPNGKKIFVVGYEDLAANGTDRHWFFQQFKSKNGKSKKRSLGTLAGLGLDEATGLMAIDGGFLMIGYGCAGLGGGCDAYLATLNGRGKLQETTMYSFDGIHDTIPESLGMGGDGNPVWGGYSGGGGDEMWIQKLMR